MRTAFLFLAGCTMMLVFGWTQFPKLLYSKTSQPATFNHRVHVEKSSMNCADCHGFRGDGTFAGIPAISGCSACHAEPMGSTESEKVLVANWVKPARDIPWRVYSRQPVNVRFPHAVHVNRAKLPCTQCHGDHGKSESLRPYQENRISGYSRQIWGENIGRFGLKPGDAMKMSDCEGCHAQHNVEAGCLGCHQ
jgi:menaquinone reductase, multiheme cytochrome c subunit